MLDYTLFFMVHLSVICSFFYFFFISQVALLCGPPGLGKTTLAHVIAQHAGYNVVEMNAR